MTEANTQPPTSGDYQVKGDDDTQKHTGRRIAGAATVAGLVMAGGLIAKANMAGGNGEVVPANDMTNVAVACAGNDHTATYSGVAAHMGNEPRIFAASTANGGKNSVTVTEDGPVSFGLTLNTPATREHSDVGSHWSWTAPAKVDADGNVTEQAKVLSSGDLTIHFTEACFPAPPTTEAPAPPTEPSTDATTTTTTPAATETTVAPGTTTTTGAPPTEPTPTTTTTAAPAPRPTGPPPTAGSSS